MYILYGAEEEAEFVGGGEEERFGGRHQHLVIILPLLNHLLLEAMFIANPRTKIIIPK